VGTQQKQERRGGMTLRVRGVRVPSGSELGEGEVNSLPIDDQLRSKKCGRKGKKQHYGRKTNRLY